MPLDAVETAGTIFSIILISIYLYIGLKICSKYFRVKHKLFLYMGFAWITLSMIWWSLVINNIMIIIDPNSWGLSREFYFFISGTPIALSPILFSLAITNLTFKKYRRFVLLPVISIGLIYEILGYIFVFTNNISILTTKTSPQGLSNNLIVVV